MRSDGQNPGAAFTSGVMILEVAILNVKPGLETAFENDFDLAASCINGIDGYVSHELQRCIETPHRYILLVRWETLKAHTEGFRKSPQYQEWKRLLHHYYDPFPTVEHFAKVQGDAQPSAPEMP